MSRDLRDLLEQTARGPCDDGFDPAGIAVRARRRARAGTAAAAAAVLAVLAGGTLWIGSLGATPPAPYVDATPPEVSVREQPSVTDHPTSTEPASLDIGPELDVDALPDMGAQGVAVGVPAGVVFVGLDGTVHGHLPGAELATGGAATSVPGPVPVHLPRAPDEEPDSRWLHPPSGSTAPLSPTTPLWGSHELVQLATGLDPSPLVLRWGDGDGGEELARFSPNVQWNVSSDHRAVSWHDCPDGAEDLSGCTAHAYDTDMGGQMDLAAGCWVSDSFADLNHAVVCGRGWEGADGSSWIERHGPGQEAQGREVRRIDLPRYVDQPDDAPDFGHYINAFFADEHIVATWGTECEVPRPVVIPPDDVPRPLVGDDFTTAPTGVVLGTTQDGRAVLRVTGGCDTSTSPGDIGIHLVDPDTGQTTPVILTDALTGAEMWSPHPGLVD